MSYVFYLVQWQDRTGMPVGIGRLKELEETC